MGTSLARPRLYSIANVTPRLKNTRYMDKGFFSEIINEIVTSVVTALKAEFGYLKPTPEPAPAENYITVKQAAKLLSVSTTTIHVWKREGKLKFYRFGTRIRFKQSEIENHEKYKK